MPAKAPDINVENAIQAYVAGEAAQVVARRFGVCGKRLTRILKERGLLRSKADQRFISGKKSGATLHIHANINDAEVAARYVAGESEFDLAKRYGVGRVIISTSLRFSGVARRSVDEVCALRSEKIPLKQRATTVASDHSGPYKMTWEQRLAAAKNFERRAAEGHPARTSPAEILLTQMLRSKQIPIIPQQAVGPYNIDLGTFPVAVEVWGGAFHFSRDHTERFGYLLDAGWHLVIVYTDPVRSPLAIGAANYIVSFLEGTRLNPSCAREYRVIWGDGEVFAAGRLNDDNIARVVPRKHFLRRRP